jgi:hypothetical protein
MKRFLLLIAVLLSTSAVGAGQNLQKPIVTPKPCTDADRVAVAMGTKLHDAHKYDEAIGVYQNVLKSSPECTQAMYELSMSYYYKGDKLKAAEVANQGTKYICDEMPLFYLTLANVLDDAGKPDEAIKIYERGIALLKDDPKLRPYLSSLSYNLAVTYAAQKKFPEAKQQLKNSIQANAAYASPNYLLAKVYSNTGYNVPAFLAAARLVSLEFNSQRTVQCAELMYGMLMPRRDDKGGISINLNLTAPKDEGDFTMYDLVLGTLTTVDNDKNKNKAPNDVFIDSIGTFIDMLAEDKKLKKTFVATNFVPFMVEMKKQGFLPVFGNVVLYIHDQNGPAKVWLDANNTKVQAFFDWAKAYSPS